MYRIMVAGNETSTLSNRTLKGYQEIKKQYRSQAEFKRANTPDEAMDLFLHDHPHILITRTNFLFQYGIEALLEQNPYLKIILISADCTLEQIVSFFNQGICYYIHEPGLLYDYINAIDKAIAEIQMEEPQIRRNQEIKNAFSLYQKEKALHQLLNGIIPSQGCMDLPPHLQHFLSMGAFTTGVLEVSATSLLPAEELPVTQETIRYHMQQYIQQNGFVFFNENHQIIVLLSKESAASPPSREMSLAITTRRIEELSRSYHCLIKAGAGKLVTEIEQIPASYKQAEEALLLASGFSKPVLIDFTQVIECKSFAVPARLISTLDPQRQDRAQWLETLNQLAASLNSQPVLSSEHIKLVACKLLHSLALHDNDALLMQAIQLQTVDDLLAMLQPLAQPQEDTSNAENLIERAKIYISQHYSDASLNLNRVAQAVYVSPTYLSRIFKQKTHLSFTDYLIQIRMEEAKKLCEQQELKTMQISAKVGYRDTSYFTLCFKKYVGTTPGNFKKMMRTSAKEKKPDTKATG